ncbi:DinB family protein [candidate division KSB1 bacterium]
MWKPEPSEYTEYYANKYICLVPEGDILDILEEQLESVTKLLDGIGEEKGNYRYGEGKWSIKEVMGHLNDEERQFAGNMFKISRGDQGPHPGIDENVYVELGNFDNRTLKSISDEFRFLRMSNLVMLKGMTGEMLTSRGLADGHELTVRAIPYIMTGHVMHHINVIMERYL